MQPEQIEEILSQALELEHVQVSGAGHHFQVVAVGAMFTDLSRVKKQQAVYAPLKEYIASNEIHALGIKALTPDEWQKQQKFGQL